MREISVRPLGLITEPNKVGNYPVGAMAQADRVRIRSFGVVESAKRWRNVQTSLQVANCAYAISDQNHVVFLVKLFSSTNWTLYYIKPDFSLWAVSLGAQFDGHMTSDGRLGLLIMRNRLIISTATRSFVFDMHLSPGAAPNAPRLTGSFQVGLFYNGQTDLPAGETGVVGTLKHCGYSWINRMVFPDGYELLSVPSFSWDFSNGSSTQEVAPIEIGVQYPPYGFTTDASFYFDLYRSRAQSVGWNGSTLKFTPVSLGSNLFLTKTVKRSTYFGSSQTVFDNTLEPALGEALYTNSSASGAAALPLPPPPSKCAAAYRGHAFFGNTFDCATLKLLVPFYWGNIDQGGPQSTLANMIGRRIFSTATAANSSPTITGMTTTTGVVPGQYIAINKTSDGTYINQGKVLSKTSTSITMSFNSTYSGAVHGFTLDTIEVNGVEYNFDEAFALQTALAYQTPQNLDVYAAAIEPSTASIGSTYPSAQPVGGLNFRRRDTAAITLRATNGNNYSPGLPEIGTTAAQYPGSLKPNALCWSENNQPENCPQSNYVFVGNGEIYQLASTRDCLWIFCSDGLFRLSGTGGSAADGFDWVVDPVDANLILAAPLAFCVHRDVVYAYTNRGLVSISSDGSVAELSDGTISDILPGVPWSAPAITATTAVWMVADAVSDDIILRVANGQWWIYNAKTRAFTSGNPSGFQSPVAAVFSQRDRRVFGYEGSTARILDSEGSTYEATSTRYQPLFGRDPFTHKHWQNIDVVYDANANADLQLTFTPNGNSSLAATRSVPVSSPAYEDKSRVGFMVPRNSPASANSLSVGLDTNEVSSPVKLQGFSASFVGFTDQRRAR